MEYKMMDEVVSFCKKCNLELNHRITRVDAGKPKKVLCLTCNAEHAFRKAPSAKTGEKKPRKTKTSTAKGDQEAEWRAILEKEGKTPKPYSMEKPFLLDDHVQHQLFGRGLVVSLIPPDKINVFFQDGLKTMKCGMLG